MKDTVLSTNRRKLEFDQKLKKIENGEYFRAFAYGLNNLPKGKSLELKESAFGA
jgi:hypothetical protein